MFEPGDSAAVHPEPEMAMVGRKIHIFHRFDKLVVLAALTKKA
jgi:hypothetical protein